MITVTKEQFLNFIKSQPDDRKLNFDEFKRSSSCGCPMIHYAREVLKEYNLDASADDWYGKLMQCNEYGTHFRFDNGFNLTSILSLVRETDMLPTTYGELKQNLIARYPEFNWQN